MPVENAVILNEIAGKTDIKAVDGDPHTVMMTKTTIVQGKVRVPFRATAGAVTVRGRKGENTDIKEIGEDTVTERNHRANTEDAHEVSHSRRAIAQEVGVVAGVEAGAGAEAEAGHRQNQVPSPIKAEVIAVVVEVGVITAPNRKSPNKVCVKTQEATVIILTPVIIM